MKPTKDTLKCEIGHRIFLLRKEIKENKLNPIASLILKNEESIYSELLSLIDIYSNRLGYKSFENSRFTPIRDSVTKEHLLIGDKVESLDKRCGTLQFDEYLNKYVIKSNSGGNIHTNTFIKIEELYDYSVDTTNIECRINPHKVKW